MNHLTAVPQEAQIIEELPRAQRQTNEKLAHPSEFGKAKHLPEAGIIVALINTQNAQVRRAVRRTFHRFYTNLAVAKQAEHPHVRLLLLESITIRHLSLVYTAQAEYSWNANNTTLIDVIASLMMRVLRYQQRLEKQALQQQ